MSGDGAERHGVGPRRIGQIALIVRDLERARRFYEEVLGLEFLFEAPPGLVFFRCGEVRLMLTRPEEPGHDHPASILYYDVSDVHAAHETLTRCGAEVMAEPRVIHRTEDAELWMGFYRDPEENSFATMAEVKASPEEGG